MKEHAVMFFMSICTFVPCLYYNHEDRTGRACSYLNFNLNVSRETMENAIMKKCRSIIKTSALSLGVLQGINKIIDSHTAANANVKVKGKYYHWKQGNVFYKVYGQGSPLLLIHDLTVFSSGYEWSQIIESLAANHTVYVIDLIGCGKSDKPLITYTSYYYVQLIRDFVSNVIRKKTDVVAAGLSSSFVFLANSMYQDLFGDIVSINPKGIRELKISPDKYSRGLIKLFRLPVLGKTLYYMFTNKSNTEYYLTEKCFYSPFKVKPTLVKAAYIASHTSNGNGKMLYASLKGNYLNMDISRAVSDAKNRIFLISGSQADNREEICSSYLKLNKNIITLSVSKTKSLPQFENPEETVQILSVLH